MDQVLEQTYGSKAIYQLPSLTRGAEALGVVHVRYVAKDAAAVAKKEEEVDWERKSEDVDYVVSDMLSAIGYKTANVSGEQEWHATARDVGLFVVCQAQLTSAQLLRMWQLVDGKPMSQDISKNESAMERMRKSVHPKFYCNLWKRIRVDLPEWLADAVPSIDAIRKIASNYGIVNSAVLPILLFVSRFGNVLGTYNSIWKLINRSLCNGHDRDSLVTDVRGVGPAKLEEAWAVFLSRMSFKGVSLLGAGRVASARTVDKIDVPVCMEMSMIGATIAQQTKDQKERAEQIRAAVAAEEAARAFDEMLGNTLAQHATAVRSQIGQPDDVSDSEPEDDVEAAAAQPEAEAELEIETEGAKQKQKKTPEVPYPLVANQAARKTIMDLLRSYCKPDSKEIDKRSVDTYEAGGREMRDADLKGFILAARNKMGLRENVPVRTVARCVAIIALGGSDEICKEAITYEMPEMLQEGWNELLKGLMAFRTDKQNGCLSLADGWVLQLAKLFVEERTSISNYDDPATKEWTHNMNVFMSKINALFKPYGHSISRTSDVIRDMLIVYDPMWPSAWNIFAEREPWRKDERLIAAVGAGFLDKTPSLPAHARALAIILCR